MQFCISHFYVFVICISISFVFCCILSLSRKKEMTTRNNNSYCWFLLNVYSKSGGPAGVQCWVHHRLLDEKHNSAKSCGLQVFFPLIVSFKHRHHLWQTGSCQLIIELIVIFCWQKMEIIMIDLNCIYLRVKSKGFFSALQPYDPLQVLSLCWVIWTNEFEDGNYIWIKVKPAWSNV